MQDADWQLDDDGTAVLGNGRPILFSGFWLTAWLGRKNLWQSWRLWRQAQKLLTTTLCTDIRARYGLADVQQAVAAYQSEMSGGKVLLVPPMG